VVVVWGARVAHQLRRPMALAVEVLVEQLLKTVLLAETPWISRHPVLLSRGLCQFLVHKSISFQR
jgi:hypothetical protein